MGNIIDVDFSATKNFLSPTKIDSAFENAFKAFDTLVGRKGVGNEYLGWLDLPSKTKDSLLKDVDSVFLRWKKDIEVIVVIGIGGSYLGTKAILEALSHHFGLYMKENICPKIVFAGQNLSEEYLSELMDLLREKSAAAVVISKSGTTTEPAVAFRIIKKHFEETYGREQSAKRIVAVTDSSKGALRKLADKEGYTTFSIPDNIGGRFSVLTPVGVLPLALGGYDVKSFIAGAAEMERITAQRSSDNPVIIYAAIRNALYESGKKVEILVNYNPKLQYVAEWWKQLYGESEGKDKRGIFPASVNFTSDLHSMGQYIQDGERILFETVLSIQNSNRSLKISNDPQNLDDLNFLSGKTLDYCNKMAEQGARIAHVDGGVPNLRITIPCINEFNLGALFFFFEKACGISAYMLGVNPFNQPGVEDYKKNMFALLGRPGYDKRAKELRERDL